MSKARAASMLRRVNRAGMSKFNEKLGKIEKRKSGNSVSTNGSKHKFKEKHIKLLEYNRRVFPDAQGEYPPTAIMVELPNRSANSSPVYVVRDYKWSKATTFRINN